MDGRRKAPVFVWAFCFGRLYRALASGTAHRPAGPRSLFPRSGPLRGPARRSAPCVRVDARQCRASRPHSPCPDSGARPLRGPAGQSMPGVHPVARRAAQADRVHPWRARRDHGPPVRCLHARCDERFGVLRVSTKSGSKCRGAFALPGNAESGPWMARGGESVMGEQRLLARHCRAAVANARRAAPVRERRGATRADRAEAQSGRSLVVSEEVVSSREITRCKAAPTKAYPQVVASRIHRRTP